MDELLSLKWKNHSSTLLKLLCSILTKDLYCDATIVCHGKYYPVHRLILSTCSDYFKDIFARAQCKHPFIIINDVKPSEMEALLSFMYKGEVNVLQQAVSLLIKAAEALKVKGLAVPDDSSTDDEPNSTKTVIKKKSSNSNPVLESDNTKNVMNDVKHGRNGDSCEKQTTGNSHHSAIENSAYLENDKSQLSSQEITDFLLSHEKVTNVKSEPEDFEGPAVDNHIFKNESSSTGESHVGKDDIFKISTLEDLQQELGPNNVHSLTFIPNSENIAKLTKATGGINWPEEDESATSSSNAFEEPSPEELLTADFGEASSSLLNSFSTNSYSDRFGEILADTESAAQFCNSALDSAFTSEFGGCSNGRTLTRKGTESSNAGGGLFTQEYIESISKEITTCPYCSAECFTDKKLRRHIIELHPGQNRFFCRLCSYSCKGNWHLRRHMLQHTGEKPYHCFICPFKTTTKQALNYHVFSHAGVKPFTCSQCPYKSTSLRGLKYHRLKYHPLPHKQNSEEIG